MNNRKCGANMPLKDLGGRPEIVKIEKLSKINKNFRTALWTGKHLQLTLMSIPTGSDIGLEMHSDTDQYLRIDDGYALVEMGKAKNELDYQRRVNGNFAAFVPAGTWHNVTNIGNRPLKISSVYAPPHHPFGTVQKAKYDEEH